MQNIPFAQHGLLNRGNIPQMDMGLLNRGNIPQMDMGLLNDSGIPQEQLLAELERQGLFNILPSQEAASLQGPAIPSGIPNEALLQPGIARNLGLQNGYI